jgi:hypothetical protein
VADAKAPPVLPDEAAQRGIPNMSYVSQKTLEINHSIQTVTVVPAGELWRLKPIHADGSTSHAGLYATRGEASEIGKAVAELIGAEFVR